MVARATWLHPPTQHPCIVGAQVRQIHHSQPRMEGEGARTLHPHGATTQWQLVQSLARPSACRRLSWLLADPHGGEGALPPRLGDCVPGYSSGLCLWWSPALGSESRSWEQGRAVLPAASQLRGMGGVTPGHGYAAPRRAPSIRHSAGLLLGGLGKSPA